MSKRKIIKIDEEKCDGCGNCIPNCPEGALQVIDGKVRLISDIFCDGLGACIGSCPVDAIEIEEREAAPYDERKAMENIARQGPNTVRAHLEHLRDHGETQYLREALDFLKEKGIELPEGFQPAAAAKTPPAGCPGSRTLEIPESDSEPSADPGSVPSALRQWPIQLHLVSPQASYFLGSDLLLAADCTAFSLGEFHPSWLKGKTLAIACPKLDSGQEVYLEKLKALVDQARINTLTVMTMEVPCCRGLLALAQKALAEAERKIPLKSVVLGINGEIKSEEWL